MSTARVVFELVLLAAYSLNVGAMLVVAQDHGSIWSALSVPFMAVAVLRGSTIVRGVRRLERERDEFANTLRDHIDRAPPLPSNVIRFPKVRR